MTNINNKPILIFNNQFLRDYFNIEHNTNDYCENLLVEADEAGIDYQICSIISEQTKTIIISLPSQRFQLPETKKDFKLIVVYPWMNPTIADRLSSNIYYLFLKDFKQEIIEQLRVNSYQDYNCKLLKIGGLNNNFHDIQQEFLNYIVENEQLVLNDDIEKHILLSIEKLVTKYLLKNSGDPQLNDKMQFRMIFEYKNQEHIVEFSFDIDAKVRIECISNLAIFEEITLYLISKFNNLS